MSAKPVTIPRWANVGGALITPASGKLDIGWVTGERPPAEYLNWLAKWNGDWAQYLSDGAFSGASTFDNTLGVTGLITASAGLTAAANQHVTVSGTGLFKYPSKVYPVPIYGPWWYLSGSQTIAQQSGVTAHKADFVCAGTNVAACIPIVGLPAGTRIINVRAVIKDVAGQPTFNLKMYGSDKAGSATQQGSTQSSAASGSNQTLTISAVNFIVGTTTAGDVYLNFGQVSNATGTYSIFSIEIDIDQP